MRRVKYMRRTKRALTLVELVTAMALTAIFAAACVVLMVPISKVYTHMKDQSRAQLVADNVVNSLRAECAKTYISASGDVWISSSVATAYNISTLPITSEAGPVLVMRRNYNHCETICADYNLVEVDAYTNVLNAERDSLGDEGEPQLGEYGTTSSRAIYRMFDPAGDPTHRDASAGYVHFGYFEIDPNVAGFVLPSKYYDFTNPLTFAAYGKEGAYTVNLSFHDLTAASNGLPAYVLCDVEVVYRSSVAYTRNDVVLSFASPVL